MNNIHSVGNFAIKNQLVPEVETKQNVYKVNFKADDDKFVRQGRANGPVYTQPAIVKNAQQDPYVRMIKKQENEQKNAKRKQNLSWGIGIASGLAIILMVASQFFRGGKDAAKVKELTEAVNLIKNDVIKREATEELARQSHERSLYRVMDLIRLDKLASTSEVRTPADINALRTALNRKIIAQEKAKKPLIDFMETVNYDIRNNILEGRPVIVAVDGPPGTCKSTLMNEAANGLGMYLKKIPLSSIEKPGSLVGFERTYVGAKGGAFATGQLEGDTKKVFYMLDELEKCPKEVQNTLLSLLDDQAKFKDLYYNCEIDLSQSVFGITTNELERLKGTALYDRIKPFVINVEKYDNATKAAIAKLKLEDAIVLNKMKDKVEIKDEIYEIIAKATSDSGGRETTNIAEKKLITELKKILNYKEPSEKVVVDKTFIENLINS